MQCSRVKNLLSAYSDRELGGDEMLAIRRHLGDCPDCRQEHEGYQQVKLLFRGLNDIVPERDFDPATLDRRPARRPSAFAVWLETLNGEAQDRFDSLRRWSRRMFPTFHTEAQLVGVACVSLAVVAALAIQRPRPADAVHAHVPALLASDYVDGATREPTRLVGYSASGANLRALGILGPDGSVYLLRPVLRDPVADLQSEPYWRGPGSDYDASLVSHGR